MAYFYQSLCMFLATGFHSGRAAAAPGTVGTLAFWFLWLLILYSTGTFLVDNSLIVAILLCCVGLVSTHQVTKDGEEKDPQYIVIDEWAGLSCALAFIQASNSPLTFSVAAFVLFRILDISKLWPISAFERLPGAFGIMADDIAAGIIAGLLLTVACRTEILCL